MRPIACAFLFLTLVCTELVYGATESEEEYLYTALWVAVDSDQVLPDRQNFLSTIRFSGSKIYSTEADYVVGFNGCSWEDSTLSISSEIAWLNFKLDTESGDTTIFESIVNGYDQDRITTVRFQFKVHFLGANIDVLGIPQPNGRVTVLYLDATKGILGFSLIDEDDVPLIYTPGIHWIEGTDGLCSRSS